MKIELEISLKTIANVLCSGLEGGINYWAMIDLDKSTAPSYEELQRVKAAVWKNDDNTYRHIHYPLCEG